MKNVVSLGLAGLIFFTLPPAAFALELQPALEQLKSYKSGDEQDSIAALELAVNGTLGHPAERTKLATQLADFLSKPADDGGKILVSLYAALVADDALVPVAADMLKNPKLSRSGASILRATGTPKAQAALVEGLSIPTAQIDVLNSFGAKPSPDAIKAIAKLLSGKVSPEVFAAGATALVRTNAASSVGTLAALAEASKGDRQVVATDRAILLMDNLVQSQPDLAKHALPVLAKLAGLSDIPPQLQGAIFITQYRLDPAGNASQLASRLASESVPEFVSAVAAVRASNDPASVKAAFDSLAKAPASHLPALIAALDYRGAKDTYSDILKLASKNPDAVVPALKAFRQLGDTSQIPAVIAFAEAQPDAVRDALASARAKEVGGLLIAQLKNASPATQAALVQALALRRDTEAFDELVPMATVADLKLRRDVLNALDVLSQPKDVPVLLATYQKAPTETARVPLARALRRNLENPASASSAPAVRAALSAEKTPAVKYGLLGFVAAIGSPEDLKLLQASLPPEGVERREWFKAAANWSGGTDGWDVIKAQIADEKEPGARQLGIQTLADLVTAKDETPAAQAGGYLRDLVVLSGDNDDALRYLLSKIGRVADPELVVTVQEIGKRPTLGEEATKAGKRLNESISRAKDAAKAKS
ncbi:MAG TPA: hypothetical protein VNB29_00670 [Chthoniobacterales bacterium]|nr:hypothetical protein [Chthoniobacterales bacterium]